MSGRFLRHEMLAFSGRLYRQRRYRFL